MMAVWTTALWVVRRTGDRMIQRWRYQIESTPTTPRQRRELAGAMRGLPGRYTDRIPTSTLRQITGSAATGRWEQAVDQLITVLDRLAPGITTRERDELRALSTALDMPVERVEVLVSSPPR
ncbi:hypothetical protein AB0L00_42375 [Actinoallomurus sp. NPDC052308]|uniref:hypothetical protein n=1 Tax=Actinoallomurus sp. NPDC052308 TaxID=3155530 RepID=UPI003431A71A